MAQHIKEEPLCNLSGEQLGIKYSVPIYLT